MANQPGSLAYNLESWVIAILRAGGVIPDVFAIVRETETARANKDRIIVTATAEKGDIGITGCEPWNCAVEIEQSTVSLDKATAETYVAATEDAMSEPSTVTELELFQFLQPLPAESESKEADGNTRRRTRVYNFLALEADATSRLLSEVGDSITTEASEYLTLEAA